MSIKNFYGDEIQLTDLKFLFLFCPNNSGTTIMSQYLAGQIGGYLPPFGNNEGQMMPAVRRMMRNTPWRPDRTFDWAFIRTQWETLVSDKVFVEASPPNLMRVPQIQSVFGRDSSALISICDPYMHVASSMRRYSTMPKGIARHWIIKAKEIRQICRSYPHFHFVSYEDFVRNPLIINDKIGAPFREVKLEGKRGSGIGDIASAHSRSVGFLKHEEVVAATEVLESASDVMDYFGYDLAGPTFLRDEQTRNPEEFAVGIARRETWDQEQTQAAQTQAE